jgi:prolyl-tRNA synthetase
MKYSHLFGKTTRNVPKDEVSINAELLTKAGFIYKVMAGVYAYTPLGFKVLDNIKQIVRQEMDAIGGQELIMSSLQPREIWESTTRWDDKVVDVWFKSKLKDGSEVGLAWSHEEALMDMVSKNLSSYKDLPITVYQFQTKLRNELRAKSGIMRGREFVMKDMYSFCTDAEQHEQFYQEAMKAYTRVYERLGLGDDTFITFASGGAFTQFSHEFQTVCEAGEDIIYLNRDKNIAVNEEVLDDANLAKLGIKREELEKVKSAEVGNIFNFGTEKSQQMGCEFTNAKGERQFVHLGSYGIGITRVMGVIVEKFHDDRGIIWPEAIAPARVHIANLGQDQDVLNQAAQIYDQLTQQEITVLWDDRDTSAGIKLADADLIGLPYRVVVSRKTLDQQKIEFKPRTSEAELISSAELSARLAPSVEIA